MVLQCGTVASCYSLVCRAFSGICKEFLSVHNIFCSVGGSHFHRLCPFSLLGVCVCVCVCDTKRGPKRTVKSEPGVLLLSFRISKERSWITLSSFGVTRT